MTIKTRQTHPDHQTVGHFFTYFGKAYYCDSYDPAIGYWMTNRDDHSDRCNVSESAIGRTFHKVHDFEENKRARLGITETTADAIEQQLRER